MKKNILITTITLFLVCSCAKKEFVILVEQQSNYKLDNLKLGITIDNNITENINLKATTITPSYITKVFAISNEENHILKIKANDILFNYQNILSARKIYYNISLPKQEWKS